MLQMNPIFERHQGKNSHRAGTRGRNNGNNRSSLPGSSSATFLIRSMAECLGLVPPSGPPTTTTPINQENAHSHTHRPIWSRQLPQLRLTQLNPGCTELRVEANKLGGCVVLENKICLWVIFRYWRHRGMVEFNATIVPLHNGPKILEKLDGPQAFGAWEGIRFRELIQKWNAYNSAPLVFKGLITVFTDRLCVF